ncbi:MAG: hypothetical protein HOE90_22590 [Bacteriovoracaceae bacterium]|jgi:hypothetical protein|nr:hypothetical protein [Bacteriovoracaceae bacterium]
MANISLKDISDLASWNQKELRKLRITIKNRLSAMEAHSSSKDLPKSHPLFEMDEPACKELLENVKRAEKKAKKE